MRSSSPLARRTGAALLLVLVVLAVLSMLGAPFVASMLLRRKQSMRASAVAQLRNAAADLRNRAMAHVYATHEDEEQQAFDRDYPPSERPVPGPASRLRGRLGQGRESAASFQTPAEPVPPQDRDDANEIAPPDLRFNVEHDNGLRILCEGRLDDEQGKVDVNRASFALLANVLGSGHLAGDVEDDDDALPLVDASAFPSDGNPRTIDGLLVVQHDRSGAFEAVTYRHKEGNELQGVVRGELLSVPMAHGAGALVADARALKIFLHRLYGDPPAEFAALAGLRRINDWPLARFFALALWHHHLDAGAIPPTPFVLSRLGEQRGGPEAAALAEAENKLLSAGLAPAQLEEAESALGLHAIVALAAQLEKEGAEKVLEDLKGELARVREKTRSRSGLLGPSAARMESLAAQEGVEALTSADLERVRDLLTVHAEPVATWSPEMLVQSGFRLGAFVVTEGAAEFLGPGAYVRLQAPGGGGGGELNLTAGDRPFVEGAYAGRSLGLAVFERRAAAGAPAEGKTYARALLRSPVNINTAAYSVITAVLKGVRLDPVATKDEDARAAAPVSEPQARALADAIWSALPMESHAALWRLFAEAAQGKTIDERQAEALRINSVNPLSPRLRVGTCGFTFRSEETYGLSVFGVARRGPVREMARLSSFEVFTAAPGRLLEHVWDTQAAFAWEVSMYQEDDRPEGRRLFALPLPGRAGYLMATYGELAEARAMPSAGAALLTSRTARLPRHAHAGDRASLVQSFPGLIEGEYLEGGSNLEYQFSAEPPYAVDFFLSPLWEAAGSGEIPLASVSDGTLDRPGSTVTLGFDSGTNELVLRVMGGVRPDPLEWGDAEDTFVGVRYRLPRLLARDTWYHIGFVVTSPEPGGQVLLLDGRPVGEGTLSGTMQGNLAAGAGGGFSIREETAAAYLPPRGPFWVGDEIVMCASRSGQGFRIGASTEKDDGETGRGCRGTPIMAHQNATVRPVGYRVPILPALIGLDRTSFLTNQSVGADCFTNPNGFALVRVATATTELMPGGAALAGSLAQSKRVVGAMPDKGFAPLPRAGRVRMVEDELAAKWGGLAPGKMPEPVPFTYPLIMAFVFYEGAPGQAAGGAGQAAGGAPRRAAAPPPDPGSGAGFPIDANYLPVPVDPRDAGFGERGILRIRYRFEGNAQLQPGPDVRAAAAEIKRTAQYDRIVEYSGIGRQAVPGDKAYPAFTGLREITRVVYYAHGGTMRTEEFFQEVKTNGLLLRQMRVYGISIPASRDLAGLYPHSGVVQIASAGASRAKYPQLRDVEWIRYNHLYKNYFISGVESAEMEDSGFRTDPGTELHEGGVSNLQNNKVMRGFCGSIGGTMAAWTETFDSGGIADHGGGAELRPVYWALGALPGAGDGVVLSPRDDPRTMERHRIHKKAETDHGVLLTFTEPLGEAARRYENPVLRRFPEPYARAGGRARAGGETAAAGGELTIGPSRFSPGALVALVDEVRASQGNAVWQAFSHYAVHAGRGGRTGGNVIPAGKEGAPVRIHGLPFLDRHEFSAAGISAESPAVFAAGEFESLFALGAEMMHVTRGDEAVVPESQVEAPRMFALAPTDTRGGQGGGAAPAAAGAGAGAVALMEPVFFTPAQLREPWSQVSLAGGTVPSGLSQGGYIVVRGFGGPEIWSFESASGTSLAGVRRGVLGSTVALLLHRGQAGGTGTAAASRDRVMPSASVAIVRGGLCDTRSEAWEAARNLGSFVPTMQVTDGAVTTTRLRGQMRGQAPPNGGYVRVDDGLPETPDRIVAYMANGNLVLDEATRDPLFTGCFGTQRGRTVRGSLIDLPFRYFDRYDVGHVTPHLQHFTRAVRKPGAFWRRLSWEPGAWAEGAALRNGPPPLIRVLVRFNGEPVWQDAAARKDGAEAKRAAAGRVTLLSDPVPPDGFALDVAADEIELRVLFFWPEGAYGPLGPGLFSDTWKVAPRLRSLVIEYQDRNEVLHREECVQ